MVKHAGKAEKVLLFVLLVCLAGWLSACGGSKQIKNPVPIKLTTPLVQVSDRQVTTTLQWVVIRDDPGSWAKKVNWDEYLLNVNNQTGDAIQITGAHIVDSTGFQHPSDSSRMRLVKASKATIRRYKEIGIDINAGYGGGAALIAAGVGAGYLASAAEIDARHTALPVTVAAYETLQLNLFFPLAPSPQRIDITYSGSFGERLICLDTNEVLNGLHIVPPRPMKKIRRRYYENRRYRPSQKFVTVQT